MHARCNVPPLSRVGNLNVSVSSDNGVTFRYQGNFLVGMYRVMATTSKDQSKEKSLCEPVKKTFVLQLVYCRIIL